MRKLGYASAFECCFLQKQCLPLVVFPLLFLKSLYYVADQQSNYSSFFHCLQAEEHSHNCHLQDKNLLDISRKPLFLVPPEKAKYKLKTVKRIDFKVGVLENSLGNSYFDKLSIYIFSFPLNIQNPCSPKVSSM